MRKTPYLTVDELPPRPDRETGLPRPPHGPGWVGTDTAEGARRRETDPERAPIPPAGQGPVLAWYQANRYGSTRIAILPATFIAVLGTVNHGDEWITDPIKHYPLWVVLIGMFVGIYLWFRRGRFSAGADWLAKRGRWVRTYELTNIAYRSYPWGAGFYFRDSGGRTVRYLMWDLGSDRLIWDLTYNGIAHSVIAGGAKTNKQARAILRMPEPDEIR